MRFTVTTLGATGGKSPDAVARRIVDYLRPDQHQAPQAASGFVDDEAPRYYAEGGNEPGRWLGLGAREAALTGDVDPDDFARILAGRDPRTGVRLITAQGSAGRRPTLAVGTATRDGQGGEAVYDARDAAASLGVTQAEGDSLLAAGERVAMLRFLVATCGADTNGLVEDPPGAYLVPAIGDDRCRWVTETELSRCEDARCGGSPPERVAAGGDPDESLPLSEAARLAGVTARYLRTLCGRYLQRREEIHAVVAEGSPSARAHLIGAKDAQGRWHVRRRDLVAFLERRRAPAVRVGYDLTLTTEKSLGILALLGDDETRRAVLDAIQEGNDVGLAYLEIHAATARAKGEPVGTRGWTVASFRHLTSRALDPFPHHHNVVANTVVDEHGTRRALDARGLYWHAVEASALATAEMRWRLTRDLGVAWRPSRHGGWEIDGIGDHLIREFSQRRNDIEDAVAELEEAIGRGKTIEELQTIVTKTRPAKRDADVDEMTRAWWRRAIRLGLTPRRLRELAGRRDVPSPDALETASIFARLAARDGLCASSSIFTRADVLAALVNLSVGPDGDDPQPLLLPAKRLEELADEFLASTHVVELLPSPGRDVSVPPQWRRLGVFTTPEMLGVQRDIPAWYEEGRAQGLGVVGTGNLDAALAQHAKLTVEQRDLVAAFCTSGYHLQCGVGRAGAGKTTAMCAAVEAWRAAGYRVRGAAVKGEAARILGAATGIASETLAWYLVQDDPETSPLDARTVLIVDEASTIPDRDLHKLLHLTRSTGTTVRLLGDPAQHGAVGAGGMFRVLCERNPTDTPELRRSQRVAHPSDVAAADALREGRVEEALAHLAAAEHLHLVDSDFDLYLDLLARWWEARQHGVEHPMVDRRNRTRRQLNRLAHRLLQASGEVGPDEIEASGGRAFAVGERVIARRTNRALHVRDDAKAYVRNGAVGTVIGTRKYRRGHRDRLTVRFDGIGEVAVPRDFFDEHRGPGGRLEVGLDHAYALTSYAVQGATYELSTSRIDEHATRAEAYVDVTRGRTENHLYLTRGIDPLDGERLPRLSPPPLIEAVSDRLEASGPERTAIEVDPSAEILDSHETTLDGLRDEHVGAVHDPTTWATHRAQELSARRIARLAPRLAGPALLGHLPERPTLPYLLKDWRNTVSAILSYRERWRETPGSDSPFGWALGKPTGEPLQHTHRGEVIDRIVDLVARTVEEDLRADGLDALPAWSRPHFEQLAARGACRPDHRTLADLYRRVDGYRRRVGLGGEDGIDAAHPILGPPPHDEVLNATRRALALELEAAGRSIEGAGLAAI